MFQSRKFRAMLFDVVVSLATYFVTKYAAPEMGKDILFVIGSLQPVVLAYILGVAYEDGQAKRNLWLNQELEPEPVEPPKPEPAPAG